MNKIIKPKDLIGKTITRINRMKLEGCDDSGFLELKFSDDTKVIIVAGYDENWTGTSLNEYPTSVSLFDEYETEGKKLIPDETT